MAASIEHHTFAVVGAAAGIGRATAIRLVQAGARVACLDRDVDGVLQLASEIGDAAVAVGCDVADLDQIPDAFAEVVGWAGQVHGLVNCAGITGVTGAPSHDVPVSDFCEVVRVNLEGAFVLTHTVLPHLLEYDYGRILHVASIAGKEGNAGMVSYSASKAGMIGMVKAQGKEYADTNITINALAPAVIRTAMVDAMPEEQVRYMTDKIPMKRCGTLEEAAELIAWIVSPACSFTTGFTFDLSGGRAVY